MGCQCTKANEKSNMDLEHAPPKPLVDVVSVIATKVEEKEKIEEVQVKLSYKIYFNFNLE